MGCLLVVYDYGSISRRAAVLDVGLVTVSNNENYMHIHIHLCTYTVT